MVLHQFSLLISRCYYRTCWDRCCHTPWTLRMASYTLSGRVFTVGHCSVPPYSEAVLHCTVRTAGGRIMPSSGLLEGLTVFAENTGLVVGRTLVDPSQWRVPVLVSNFSQDTVMVEPFFGGGHGHTGVHHTGLHAAVSHFPYIFVTFWIRCPGLR